MSNTARSILCAAILLGLLRSGVPAAAPAFQDGDIIFQTSRSSQSEAIQLATHSKWTHVGILVHRGGVLEVYEAHGPVGFRTFDSFVSSGVGGKYMVRRYRRGLSAGDLKRLEAAGEAFAGRPYDAYFGWGDSEIYCSELVWKIFKRGLGVYLGERQRLGDFDLSDPGVKRILRQRYGDRIPVHEWVISPKALAESPSLKTVFEN